MDLFPKKRAMDGDGDDGIHGEDNIFEANPRHEPSDQQGDSAEEQQVASGGRKQQCTASGAASGKKGNKALPRNFKTKQPAFTKSISHGLLEAGMAHHYFGPAKLNWEGGFEGERGIASAKKLMGIKRYNTDWQTISLKKMYQLDSLKQLTSQNTFRDENDSGKSKEMQAKVIKIYANQIEAAEDINLHKPLVGILDHHGKMF